MKCAVEELRIQYLFIRMIEIHLRNYFTNLAKIIVPETTIFHGTFATILNSTLSQGLSSSLVSPLN